MQDIHKLMLRALDPLLRRFEALSPLFVTTLEIVYDHPGETEIGATASSSDENTLACTGGTSSSSSSSSSYMGSGGGS